MIFKYINISFSVELGHCMYHFELS